MIVYFDSAYLVKCYLVGDRDCENVRQLVRRVETVYSSVLCIAEVSCALHRAIREKSITRDEASHLRATFAEDVSREIVKLLPVSETILLAVEATVANLPATIFLRAGDAIHLASAQHEGFSEIWSNDRHMLRAAPHFEIVGRTA